MSFNLVEFERKDLADRIWTPFTPLQVKRLNQWQDDDTKHEFTCGLSSCGTTKLVATVKGWKCPKCGYRQNWAHKFMAE